MRIAIILLIVIIGTCLANSTIEPFISRGDDYNPQQYMSSECPMLSCINQPCVSPYKS